MITKTEKLFTYEDVRLALVAYTGLPIKGVRISQEGGYVIESCSKKNQPRQPNEPQECIAQSSLPVEVNSAAPLPTTLEKSKIAKEWLEVKKNYPIE